MTTKQQEHMARIEAAKQERMAKVEAQMAEWAESKESRQWTVAWKWEQARADVDAFGKELARNADPAHAFEWASSAMKAAATMEFLGKLVASDEDRRRPFAEALAALIADLTQRLLRNEWAGHSTSYASNAMDAARREAASSLINDFGGK